jgi:hypothetical protein
MYSQTSPSLDRDDLRRRVAHELYTRLAFTSFVIWTGGCLILFILFAANSPRPIFPAMLSMMLPLIPAALIWVVYRPLIARRVARHLRADMASPS